MKPSWERRRGRGHLLGTPVEWVYTRFSPSFYRARRRAPARLGDFVEVEAFCLFVGHPRSGHTLVGELLNAHPEVVIAHERDAMQFAAAGCTREQLFWLLVERDAQFAAAGSEWQGYDYRVPGQWQGRFRRLRVIGDKHGAAVVERLGRRPELLARFAETVEVPLRLVHVVRDPRDNIPTLMRRGGRTLDEAIDFYFASCEPLAALHRSHAEDLLIVALEDVVAEPVRELRRLAGFLGVEAPEEWVAGCASIVFDRPRRTRDSIDWPPPVRRRVEAAMAGYPWLRRYLTP